MEREAGVALAVGVEGGGGGRGRLLLVFSSAVLVGEGVRGVDVDDDQVKRGAAALGELVLDVLVEQVQEHGGGDAHGEAEEVAPGARGRAARRGPGRRDLLAQDADLLDALVGDELGEAVSAMRCRLAMTEYGYEEIQSTHLQTGWPLLSCVASWTRHFLHDPPVDEFGSITNRLMILIRRFGETKPFVSPRLKQMSNRAGCKSE